MREIPADPTVSFLELTGWVLRLLHADQLMVGYPGAKINTSAAISTHLTCAFIDAPKCCRQKIA